MTKVFLAHQFYGTPLRKPLSQRNSVMDTRLYYLYTKKKHIQAKKSPQDLPFQNGSQISDFRFVSFRFRQQFEKELFFFYKI